MMIITQRNELAAVMNFDEFPVLTLDFDAPLPFPDSPNFRKGCDVRVAWDKQEPRYKGMTSRTTLTISDNEYSLSGHGACLKADFSVLDVIENARWSNAPVVHKDQIVAVVHYSKSKNVWFAQMMKVSHWIDPHCMTVARLENVNDEEKKWIQNSINRILKW